jgi:hypothetical protein
MPNRKIAFSEKGRDDQREGRKLELNLYLSSDVVSSLFSTASITRAFMCF